jgi:uncharacterized repeat protein (TIGR01451 family)
MKPIAARLIRSRAGVFLVNAALLMFLFGFWGAQTAYAGLTITPTSWNVIGLDSNNVNSGPDTFQIGARICNTGGTAVTNVSGTFVWDSFNSYINLKAGNSASATSLASGSCVDFYYPVIVTRTSAAYNATRGYHITVTGDSVVSVSTPTPRELFVEHLISQNRNSVNSITGPTTVYVGQTYNYTVNASTATQGYEQLEAFLDLSNIIFQVQAISTTYTAPSGATNNKFYADACGWDNNPLSATYRSCIGPVNYPGGKAGGTVITTYTVKVLSTGTTTAGTLVLDFSGSSYHYNSDYGVQLISITALPPLTPDLTITKSHTGNFTQGQTGATYSITVTNSGLANSSGTVTVTDTLPAGLTATAISGTNWTCVLGTLTCTRSNALLPGLSYPAITVTVNVANNAPASVTNTANVAGGGEIITTNDTATDPTTINQLPDLTITKSHTGNFTEGQTGTYSITVTNSGLANSSGTVTVTDTLPAGLTATAISGTNWTCVLGTLTCTRSNALAPGLSYPAITVTVNVANNAPASVTNTANVSGGGEIITSNDTANDLTTIDAATPPGISLVKSVNPSGTQMPGTDLLYTIDYTNTGGQPATDFMIVDPNVANVNPAERVFHNVDLKIGSLTSSPGSTGLVATFEYSNDGGTTWTYTPVSGAGGAPAGYDRLVTNIRWSFAGNLSPTNPNNAGSVGFTVRIR